MQGAVEVASETTPTGQSQLTATIDDLSPRNGDVRTFLLRIDTGAIDSDIDVDQITVHVENDAGTRALTFVRFDEAALRSESSVMATVRVEGLDAGTSFVVVRVDDLEVERIPLG